MPTKRRVLIRARALMGFADVVRSLGGDPARLLARASLPASALDEPDATLPFERVVKLVETAATALDAPDFGLRLAQRQDISVLGAVGMVALHSATVGDALRAISRHLPYHTPAVRITLAGSDQQGFAQLSYEPELEAGVARRQACELSLAVAIGFLRLVTRDPGSDWHVDFTHRPALSAARYRKYFDCAVHFGQPIDCVVFPMRLLDVPIDPGSAELRKAAERYVSNLVRRFPLDIGQQVEALIERQLATGGCGIERVAAQLGMHRRTLQRRLEAQGLHFEDIVDRVRRERADQLLPHAAIPLGEVCELLGYSEQSSFNRACRRWYGTTPQARRRAPRQGAAAMSR